MLYTENAYSKSFQSPDFSWFLDKSTGISLCWGVTKEDTPDYDPISPDTVTAIFDKSWVHDEKLWNKLLSIDNDKSTGDFVPENCFLSTIANAEIAAVDGLTDEIVKTMKWLKSKLINVMLKLQQSQVIFKEAVILQNSNVDFVCLEAEDTSTLKKAVDLLLMNQIMVRLQIDLSKNDAEDVCKFLHVAPKSIEIVINANDEESIDKIAECALQNNVLGTIITSETVKKDHVSRPTPFLFSCVYDFISREVYFNNSRKPKYKMSSIESITDYWNAAKTERARKKILK